MRRPRKASSFRDDKSASLIKEAKQNREDDLGRQKETLMRLRLRAALSYLPIFAMILSFFLSLSLSKKRSLSKSSSSLERDDDDPPPLFLPLCRRCCSLDEKQSQQHQHHRKQREREQRFLAASFETFFLSLFFYVSLLSKCLGYYIEKKKDSLLDFCSF